jgi:poly(3-hydroxyalkanoate) synthetase
VVPKKSPRNAGFFMTLMYKAHLLTDTEVTFCLSSGGHNAGIVNPPLNDSAQSYQITNRAADAAYVDAQTWKISAPVCRGSWGGCRQRHCQGHRLHAQALRNFAICSRRWTRV